MIPTHIVNNIHRNKRMLTYIYDNIRNNGETHTDKIKNTLHSFNFINTIKNIFIIIHNMQTNEIF